MTNILVFLEQREGVIKKASLEAWNRAQELFVSTGGSRIFGLIPGPVTPGPAEALFGGEGVIFHASEAGLELYNQQAYMRLVADIWKQQECSTLIFADTALSRDLAPRLSVRLGASLLSGCSSFSPAGVFEGCSRPVYSGSALATFHPERSSMIYTLPLRGGSPAPLGGGQVTIVPHETRYCSGVDLFPVVRRLLMHHAMPDVAEAAVIVAGGRGMGGQEGFVLLERLARLFGGTVGASRAAVDEGWRAHAEQIGQTGKTVAPLLYIACGISGAVQHLSGIASAGTVVAINSDPHAPIFDVADYALVGDLHLVLPKLLEAAEEFLKTK